MGRKEGSMISVAFSDVDWDEILASAGPDDLIWLAAKIERAILATKSEITARRTIIRKLGN